jgi:DNA-binding MarR family transcriptional regulator
VERLANTQQSPDPQAIREHVPRRGSHEPRLRVAALYADPVATDDTLRDLEHEMGVLIRRIRRVIAERARMIHPELPAVSYLMLSTLNNSGPARASTLVETFAIDKGAVSRHVQFLIELGLLERSPDPEDRRAAILAITEEGCRRLAEVSTSRREKLEAMLHDWTDAELEHFVRTLARYNAALE